MPFDKHNTFLRFAMPPDSVDWGNLAASKASGVQIQWAHTGYKRNPNSRPLIETIASAGYKVILRLNYEDSTSHTELRDKAKDLRHAYGANILGVVLFNEPDVDPQDGKPIDLTKGSLDWGQHRAAWHSAETMMARDSISDFLPCIAAPLCNRPWREDDQSEPGLQEWWTELRPAYHSPAIRAVGAHIYENSMNDDPGSVDVLCMKQKLRVLGQFWQPPLFIDEFNITDTPSRKWSAAERGQAWVSMIKWLERCKQAVIGFSPFISNGIPNAYPSFYIVRERVAYDILGAYLAT